MRKGRQYRIFDASPKPGLSNYLSEANIEDNNRSTKNLGEYVQETPIENLYIIAAGNVPPNPSELLVSKSMIKLLEDLKELCDIVIIDGTPCELVADSIILSRIVDSTIIITAHKSTKKDALQRVIKNIQNVGGKISGIVVNKMPATTKRYGQKYYYYGESSKSKNKKNKNKKMEFNLDVFKKKKSSTDRIESDIAKLQQEINQAEELKNKSIDNNNNEVQEFQQEWHNIETVNHYIDSNNNDSIQNQLQNDDYNNSNFEQQKEEHNTISNEINNFEENQNNQDLGSTNTETQSNANSFVDKTNQIMQQINEYIEKEKNNNN